MGDPIGESRSNMRIFLAVLLALVLADTITGSPTSRRTRREKGEKTRKRKSSSGGSRTLLKKLNKQLNELKVAEETRDTNIEAKMDKAIDELKTAVKAMHSELKEFIEKDEAISSSMKTQIDDMSAKVLKLDDAVMDAINSINDGIQTDQPDDDMMTHHADHIDVRHDGHGMESMGEAVPEPEIRRKGRPMPEESIHMDDEGSTSGNGENEGEEAPAQDPVAVEEPANYEYGGSGYGGSGEGADYDDYGYGDYKA